MRIKILAVENKKVEEGKKNYNLLDVSYKNLEFNKVEGKKIVSFASPDVYHALEKAQPGDEFDVTKGEKSAQGFVPWTRCVTASDSGVESGNVASTGAQGTTQTSVRTTPKSTYETPEERAKRQVLIVRQSSVTAALKLAELNKVKDVTVEYVTNQAKQFERYVFGNDPVQELMNMESDIPF